MINAYCLVGNMKKAMGLVDDMVSTGLEPNVHTYGALINGYYKMEGLMMH
jgi:pentatricopeptide repeat protein